MSIVPETPLLVVEQVAARLTKLGISAHVLIATDEQPIHALTFASIPVAAIPTPPSIRPMKATAPGPGVITSSWNVPTRSVRKTWPA